MKLIVKNIKASLNDEVDYLKFSVAKKLKISTDEILSFKIIKESIDARKKSRIHLVYNVMIEIASKRKDIFTDNDVRQIEENDECILSKGNIKLKHRPIVIGSGPAGLFAGLTLAENGYNPIIIERGQKVDERARIVKRYWEDGCLDLECNVQFGEGGAGTFSDGKLTTRINDRRCHKIIQDLYKSGAPEDILYKAKPHIGTDILRDVVINLRKRIESMGGEFRFGTKLTSINITNNKLKSIFLNYDTELPCEALVLAIGHSARDTYKALLDNGLNFERKPFSVGVRIEHPCELINKAQYGTYAEHPRLGAAEYQLFHKTKERTAYTFCMCPGGVVVASASEHDTIVTNGMSERKRDKANSNSAWVVSVEPSDFSGDHPLAGLEFQRNLEMLAFKNGGSNNGAPIQRLGDFLNNTRTIRLGKVKPSYTGRVSLSDINLFLPDFIRDTLKQSISYFDSKLKGFGMDDALLTAVETRTSSPIRILRNENFEALGVKGLYPAGEGAGYAGGIVSAAVDGVRVGEQIVKTFC